MGVFYMNTLLNLTQTMIYPTPQEIHVIILSNKRPK